MAKIPEMLGSSDIGDISGALNDQSISDLRWLNVDPDEYRKFEALPKQNLDSIPELSESLAKEPDEKVPQMVPLRPITVVNTKPLERLDTPSRASVLDNLKKKVAKLVVAGKTASEIKKILLSEYSIEQIRSASDAIADVLKERGLLGNVYVDADHYPGCHNPKDESHGFVSKFASRSQYILSKQNCIGCIRNQKGFCQSFQKRIVSEVPYNRDTLATHIGGLVSTCRVSKSDLDPFPNNSESIKNLLRVSFRRTPTQHRVDPVQTAHHQRPQKRPTITEAHVVEFLQRQKIASQKKPLPSSAVRNAVLSLTRGHSPAGLSASLSGEVRQVAKEYGLVGHTYIDVDALGGPKSALGFISTKRLNPDFLIVRHSYSAEDLAPLLKSFNVFPDRPVLGLEHLKNAMNRAVHQGRMDLSTAERALQRVLSASVVDWDKVVSQVNLYDPPKERTVESTAFATNYYNGRTTRDPEISTDIDPSEIRRTISHLMNTGLTGEPLKRAILSRYTKQDLSRVPEIGQQLSSVDGIQGFFHIDPTAYSDYGKGCSQGSRTLRHSSAPNVMISSKCTGCRLQTAPSWCSKYAKILIRNIPETIISASLKRSRLPVVQDSVPVENPVEKYELSSELPVDHRVSSNKSIELVVSSQSVTD